MEKYKEIEKSIIKKFRKSIWSKFVRAIKDYELISENDNIMVCISGGKDSFLMAKCLEEIKRHGKIHFNIHYVTMNPGYNKINMDLILQNAKILNIPLEVFNSDIFDVVNSENMKNPCYLCAKMRRGYLYSKAKELGCNKIALGHHFNDVIETNLLSILYSAETRTMMPKLHSENFKGLELIRPMYLIKEEDIIAWADYNTLKFINCACRFTENVSKNTVDSKREEIKKLIKNLKSVNPDVDHNIFKALDNVNLNCVLGIKKNGVYKSFLNDYNQEDNYFK